MSHRTGRKNRNPQRSINKTMAGAQLRPCRQGSICGTPPLGWSPASKEHHKEALLLPPPWACESAGTCHNTQTQTPPIFPSYSLDCNIYLASHFEDKFIQLQFFKYLGKIFLFQIINAWVSSAYKFFILFSRLIHKFTQIHRIRVRVKVSFISSTERLYLGQGHHVL